MPDNSIGPCPGGLCYIPCMCRLMLSKYAWFLVTQGKLPYESNKVIITQVPYGQLLEATGKNV